MLRIIAMVVLVGVISSSSLVAQPPANQGPTKEHEWLNQFIGQWTSQSEATIKPGQAPMTTKGRMSSRMLGKLWVVSDVSFDMDGTLMSAIQTIGYDPAKKKYVGTWVDSMMNHLWQYEGSVDETGKILTLEAEGPDLTSPDRTTTFRDAYEFKSRDHIVVTSSALNEEGKWVTFMTGDMRREK
jgi:hypothetical protein